MRNKLARLSAKIEAITELDHKLAAISALDAKLAAVSALDAKLEAVAAAQASIQNALARIEAGFGLETLASNRAATAIQAAGWVARSLGEVNTLGGNKYSSNYRPAVRVPIEESFRRLEALDPRIYPIWKQLFDNAVGCYDPSRPDVAASASVWEHNYARIFGAYVSMFATGRVLDVGCGPIGIPSYLAGISSERLSLLDPLVPSSVLPCEFVQGFNEFLPWPDSSFEAVVSGTSLDHVLSLERSLAEVARVLVSGGRYIVWIASIPGSPPYDPQDPNFSPRDDYHLFHFDRKWIEPLLARYFDFEDVTVIPQPGFDHVFYCLNPKVMP